MNKHLPARITLANILVPMLPRGHPQHSHALGQDFRKYDFKDGIGRVESGTETENNASLHGCNLLG